MNYDKLEEERRLRSELISTKLQLNELQKENTNLRNEKIRYREKTDEHEIQLKKRIRVLESEIEFGVANSLYDGRIECSLGREIDERIKDGLSNILLNCDFLSDEMIARAKIFQEVFFEDFPAFGFEKIVERIEEMRIEGQKFVDVFMLFSQQKRIFERYWEDFYDLPLYIREKKEVLESVPIEWVIEHIEDEPKPKKFLLEYKKPETMNGLKKYIIRYKKMLYEFFCELVGRKPEAVRSMLSQEGFDTALREGCALGRKLLLGILESGGLGYVNEKNIGELCDEEIELCYKKEYKEYVNVCGNEGDKDGLKEEGVGMCYRESVEDENGVSGDVKGVEGSPRSEECISFNGDIDDFSS